MLCEMKTPALYLSVLCGMVGSMDTMAPDESSKDRLVFLNEDTNKLTGFNGRHLYAYECLTKFDLCDTRTISNNQTSLCHKQNQ